MALPRLHLNRRFGGVAGEAEIPGSEETAAWLETVSEKAVPEEEGSEASTPDDLEMRRRTALREFLEARSATSQSSERAYGQVDPWEALARTAESDLAEEDLLALRDLLRIEDSDLAEDLRRLELHGGPPTIPEIARTLSVSPSQAALIYVAIKRLTAEGGSVDDPSDTAS